MKLLRGHVSSPLYTFLWPEDGPQWPKHVVSINKYDTRQSCFYVPHPLLKYISKFPFNTLYAGFPSAFSGPVVYFLIWSQHHWTSTVFFFLIRTSYLRSNSNVFFLTADFTISADVTEHDMRLYNAEQRHDTSLCNEPDSYVNAFCVGPPFH